MDDGDRTAPRPGPRTQVAIHILDDGRVIFGDLPPELAEVAAILRGELGQTNPTERAPLLRDPEQAPH